jgi:hypothetical protein
MPSFFERIKYFFKPSLEWRDVRRVMTHPVFGEMEFVGTRSRREGPVSGMWRLNLPGFTRYVGVTFPNPGGDPTPEDLKTLESLLADLDTLFERSRREVAAEYEEYKQEPMPAGDWRSLFRLDHIQLPDPVEPETPWQVVYWCEAAQHWFTVEFVGEAVTYVGIDG